ncbi:hypothetical protein LUZ60_008600 [Juncus effusus]|nr:hypothetical protein LUZ60_008600 [Juncus effusus]
MRIVDWELLDCVVCFQPLCPPLYLCLNGHQTCGKCSPRIKNCSLCNAVPSGGRNHVEHLTECLFAVTCCPDPCCTFSSYPHGTVIAHGMSNHGWVVLRLTIGETNVFSIADMEPFSFIRDDKGRDYVAFMKHNGREMKFALLLLQGP